ncbi:peptide-methionine (S)-S-oxide reductase MsrA [Mycoplasmopsis citelli]|uniref:peptide-methionine (S)-S-oxide reductase MsrA n=1 Tax=Mycoplasmopsis citelli TaxID=171281 RepID=UPI0021153D32|nr:peptide-methionine (S)-S-oxide reductase MsrA [Mycoplasmopsis citelli]UUD36564.1 peptide-methionine (S)-S-oxide reductase MsrA [Mycoplasmopsis citelli]
MEREVYLAGGCFWGVQAYFAKVNGVLKTSVHYLNGGFEGVSYKEVCNNSSHVEAVKIIYDSKILSEAEIFDLFLGIINPYSYNKQGNDKGVQYRVGIYCKDPALRHTFNLLNNEFKAKERKDNYIEILDVFDDTLAEEYHQDYLSKNPLGYCHINLNSLPKKYQKDDEK